MKVQTVSTEDIRNDLKGFLRKIKQGRTFRVMYRSKPLVTVTAATEADRYTAQDAGTPAAARRSAAFARSLPKSKPKLDVHKSFKELYEETQQL